MSARYDITIDQGAKFALSLQLVDDVSANPIDLTGKSGRFRVMSKDAQTLVATGSVVIAEPLVGKVELNLASDQTALIAPKGTNPDPFYASQDYLYDFDIIGADSEPVRYLMGLVSVRRGMA